MPSSLREALVKATNRVVGSRQMNQLVRFDGVLPLVEERGGTTVLDAGSGSLGVSSLLPERWRATALDLEFDDGGAPVRSGPPTTRVAGDVRRLPFPDACFDVVVAVDLLEHVPAGDRQRAVAELCRVARLRSIIACPTGAEALRGDQGVAARLQGRGRQPPAWLQEHLELGFPDRQDLVGVAQRWGRVTTSANESIAAHERLIVAELNPLAFLPLRLLSLALSVAMRSQATWARSAAGKALGAIRGRDRDPAYRTVLCVDVDGSPPPGAGA